MQTPPDSEIGPTLHSHVPPKGAWYTKNGAWVVIGAKHRDVSAGFAALIFGLFWNSGISVFVALALSSTFHNLHFSLPSWLSAFQFDVDSMDVPMTLYYWTFLTPFILVGLFCIGWFLSSMFGRTEVRVLNTEGTIFVGLGRFGYMRRFDASCVRTVLFRRVRNSEGGDTGIVVMSTSGGNRIKFGSMLSEARCRFVADAVKKTLVP